MIAQPQGVRCSIKRSDLSTLRSMCTRRLSARDFHLSLLERWYLEGAGHALHEISLLTQDQALPARHVEILPCLGVGTQFRTVSFVGCQALEGDQSPRDVIRAFVGEEIPHQMATTARDDAPPVGGVLPECIPLKRIDLVTDDAGDGRRLARRSSTGQSPTAECRGGAGARRSQEELAAAGIRMLRFY